MYRLKKFLVICGPTATGKTVLAIKLAQKFNGEILSADSRQVYKQMDIGTGKDINNFKFEILNFKSNPNCQFTNNKKITIGYYRKDNIKIWGIDFVNPDYQFNVGEYKEIAQQIINNIWQREKLPIVVGGTGLYIKALLEPMEYIRIPPDNKLREILRYCDIGILRKKLKKLDKDRLEKMNNSDRNNPRRLIRAIEIARYLNQSHYSNNTYYYSGSSTKNELPRSKLHGIFGKQRKFFLAPSSVQQAERFSAMRNKNILLIGLKANKNILFTRIQERIKKRLKQGIVQEIQSLLNKGFGWDLPAMSGLGYREFKEFFQKTKSLNEVIKKWQTDEQSYAKRQLVWFKKMPINWFDISKDGFYTEVEKLVCNFLQKS